MNREQDLEQRERMQALLDWQPSDRTEICVNCGCVYDPALSEAGQPHRFCNRKCEIGFWKIEVLGER